MEVEDRSALCTGRRPGLGISRVQIVRSPPLLSFVSIALLPMTNPPTPKPNLHFRFCVRKTMQENSEPPPPVLKKRGEGVIKTILIQVYTTSYKLLSFFFILRNRGEDKSRTQSNPLLPPPPPPPPSRGLVCTLPKLPYSTLILDLPIPPSLPSSDPF